MYTMIYTTVKSTVHCTGTLTVHFTTLYTNFKVNGWASLISEEYVVAEHFTVQPTVTSTVTIVYILYTELYTVL